MVQVVDLLPEVVVQADIELPQEHLVVERQLNLL